MAGKTRRGSRGGSKKVPERILNDEEGVVVKVLEFGQSASGGGSSKQLTPDLFESVIQEGEVIRPIYDPLLWAMLLEQNVRLNRCVGAMALNTVGLGFELAALRDSKEFVDDHKDDIKAERERLLPLFKYPNAHYSFEEMMQWIKTDEEAEGQAYLEVSRNGRGEIDGMYHAPGHTIRVMARGEGFLQMRTGIGSESFLFSPGKTAKDSVEKVYFKNFGDKRVMDKNTGEFGGGIPLGDHANELIMFKIYSPRSSYYGVPRFVAAAPAISGNRLAQLRNVAFFENDACQPLSAKILTPHGWSRMGDIKVGSKVIGSDGKPHEVTGVYPQEERQVYKVTFLDGTETECDADHVWTVSNNYDRKCGVTRNMTLRQLMGDGLWHECGAAKWAVPMVDPVEFEDTGEELPVDPYLLGLLLGNGCFRGQKVGLSGNLSDLEETKELIRPLLSDGTPFSERERSGWFELNFKKAETSDYRQPSTLWKAIESLGLGEVSGEDKFVPVQYFTASVEDRISLLQGLIDSAGHIGETVVRYATNSCTLAENVKEIVGSLGGTAIIRPVKNRGTYQVAIQQLPEGIIPARLPGKADAYSPSEVSRWRAIDRIEPVRTEFVQCIMVDVEDHLYVTDDFILTHNTPRLAVIVSGGTLDSGSVKMIQNFIEAKGKGVQNFGRVMVLQPEQEAIPGADAGKVKIDLVPLTVGVTEDASFTRYLTLNDEIIREAFGIGKIFLGTTTDTNRATAFTMKQITMEQVFEPEIKRYEHRLNITLMRDLGAKFTRLKFRRPRMTDVTQEAMAYATLAAAGGVSPNDIRELLEFDPFQGDWGNTPLPVLKMGYTEGEVEPPANPEEEPGAGRPPQGLKQGIDAELDRVTQLYGEATGYDGSLNLIVEGEPVEVLKQLREQFGE